MSSIPDFAYPIHLFEWDPESRILRSDTKILTTYQKSFNSQMLSWWSSDEYAFTVVGKRLSIDFHFSNLNYPISVLFRNRVNDIVVIVDALG